MVWSYTTEAISAAGVMANRQELSPGVYYMRGTWNAAAVTAGSVDLATDFGVTDILAGDFNCLTGTGITLKGLNVSTVPAASMGMMSIVACTANDTGTWWAQVLIN